MGKKKHPPRRSPRNLAQQASLPPTITPSEGEERPRSASIKSIKTELRRLLAAHDLAETNGNQATTDELGRDILSLMERWPLPSMILNEVFAMLDQCQSVSLPPLSDVALQNDELFGIYALRKAKKEKESFTAEEIEWPNVSLQEIKWPNAGLKSVA